MPGDIVLPMNPLKKQRDDKNIMATRVVRSDGKNDLQHNDGKNTMVTMMVRNHCIAATLFTLD